MLKGLAAMRWAVTYPLVGFSSFFRQPFLWVLAPSPHTAIPEFPPFCCHRFLPQPPLSNWRRPNCCENEDSVWLTMWSQVSNDVIVLVRLCLSSSSSSPGSSGWFELMCLEWLAGYLVFLAPRSNGDAQVAGTVLTVLKLSHGVQAAAEILSSVSVSLIFGRKSG